MTEFIAIRIFHHKISFIPTTAPQYRVHPGGGKGIPLTFPGLLLKRKKESRLGNLQKTDEYQTGYSQHFEPRLSTQLPIGRGRSNGKDAQS